MVTWNVAAIAPDLDILEGWPGGNRREDLEGGLKAEDLDKGVTAKPGVFCPI